MSLKRVQLWFKDLHEVVFSKLLSNKLENHIIGIEGGGVEVGPPLNKISPHRSYNEILMKETKGGFKIEWCCRSVKFKPLDVYKRNNTRI